MRWRVQENVLFGAPYEKERYASVLAACALADDIAGLPAGDATQLGERGINLSGEKVWAYVFLMPMQSLPAALCTNGSLLFDSGG